MALAAQPEPLAARHDVGSFASGNDELDSWLAERARPNEQAGASRTFVICDGPRVVGYYSLSAFSLQRSVATGRARRNMPDPLPAVLLGRLAVGRTHQHQGIGGVLLRDAMRRTVLLAEEVGVRLLVAQALDQRAADYYIARGFEPSTTDPLLVFILVKDL